MRVLIQRVNRAEVTVAGEAVGTIGRGLLILAGVTTDDGNAEVTLLANKVANLRIFDDTAGQLNRSALDLLTAGDEVALLVVSQFTLYADCRKGRRPSFVHAAPPAIAAPLVAQFAATLRTLGFPVAEGRFGEEMAVALVNDGPVTIWLDTTELGGRREAGGGRREAGGGRREDDEAGGGRREDDEAAGRSQESEVRSQEKYPAACRLPPAFLLPPNSPGNAASR